MIQRIQSIYLLIVLILSSVTLFSPWASFIYEGTICEFSSMGLRIMESEQSLSLLNPWALTAIATIIPVLALISLFLYKKRILQIRLNIFNLLSLVGFYLLFLLYFYIIQREGIKIDRLHIAVIFPLINLILTYLAIRAIGKDEALLRSLNRIR